MKKIYSFLLLFFCVGFANAQIISIPDANFKAKLFALGVDTNNDGNIQQSEALSKTNLNVSSSNISDLTGINAFSNLTQFTFNNNSVTNLTALNGLSNLSYLSFYNNDVTTFNGLANLPALITINCNQNSILNLSGLTNVPALQRLDCNGNYGISLAGISNLTNLKFLSCENTGVTNLGELVLLPNFESLWCGLNPQLNLATINGITNLRQLSCRYINLNNLNMISGLTNLILLDISNNNFSTLSLPTFTQLQDFICNDNHLTSLNLVANVNLIRLYCENNNLTSLNISTLTALQVLDVYDNNITALDFSNTLNIRNIQCSYNNLVTIDASNLSNLGQFNCTNMPSLISVNLKNGSVNWNYTNSITLTNNPNLQYVCANDAQVPLIQSQIANYPNCHVNSYCTFVPGGTFYTIRGTNKYDINNNGCGSNGLNYPGLKILFNNGSSAASLIADNSGNYHYEVQASTQTFSPVLENPGYFSISPSSATVVNFPGSANPFIQNFCISANGTHNDLEISLLPINVARPGFDAKYVLIYKNKGTHAQSGTVNFTFDDAISDYVTSVPNVSNQTANSLVWNFVNLQPFEKREIALTINLNSPIETPALNIGDNLNFSIVVNGLSDENPGDNTFVLHQTVVGSLDPNDKTCLEGDTIAPAMIGKDVHYMIRFENTGTANAENIVVRDLIDASKFDINSLVPLSGSHPYTTKISNTNKVEFFFENINLPFDDAHNDGYVAFKIKTKPTLAVGDTFSNTANIYFDYNAPIVTNTATTTIQALANTDFDFSAYFTLTPNPVKDILTIHSSEATQISSLSIYNSLGQLVMTITQPENTIDASALKSGSYFIKINSDKGSSATKFLKK